MKHKPKKRTPAPAEANKERNKRVRIRRPRCKQVKLVLGNNLETVDLVREETHPSTGDFSTDPLEVAVVEFGGVEISAPLDSVIFLHDRPPATHSSEATGPTRNKVKGKKDATMGGSHS